MKTDWYLKFILTVIAVCLVALVMRDVSIIPEAQAALDQGDKVVKVQIVGIEDSPQLEWGSLPVRIVR